MKWGLLDAANLIAELKRRRVFRVLVGYGVVSFAVLQIVEPIMHALHLSEATLTYTVVALALGFPLAVVLAWAFDINQGRIERTAPAPGGARLGLVLLAIGVLAAAPGAAWYFFLRGKPAQPAAAVSAAPSIAVLAFADLSPAKDQEYFSDGIAEEILNALARVRGLHVSGRTSSFAFKGKNLDLRSIGETLGVATLLEGSVRKQGNKVRITAQLIQASDGFHLWSRTFDGELTDVFELQERIARGITEELKVVLQGDASARLVPVMTRDPEAHALYLQATRALNQRDPRQMGQAIGWLEQAIALDPKFARGHARLAMLHSLGGHIPEASPAKGEEQARLASELDPSLAEPWVALGLIAWKRGQLLAARAADERAFALDPDDPYVNLHYGQALIATGYRQQGIARLDRALAIDPILPSALFWRAVERIFAGDIDAAEHAFERARALGMPVATVGLAEVAKARGDYQRARALADKEPVLADDSCIRDPAISIPKLQAAYYGGNAAENAQAAEVVAACLATRPLDLSAWVPYVILELGPPAHALEVLAGLPIHSNVSFLSFLWGTGPGQAARRTPQFAEFARKAGYADLWERYGTPDDCRRVAPRDYSCE